MTEPSSGSPRPLPDPAEPGEPPEAVDSDPVTSEPTIEPAELPAESVEAQPELDVAPDLVEQPVAEVVEPQDVEPDVVEPAAEPEDVEPDVVEPAAEPEEADELEDEDELEDDDLEAELEEGAEPALAGATIPGVAAPVPGGSSAARRRNAPAQQVHRGPTQSELAVRVTDSSSAIFVIATVVVFVAILAFGLLAGNGGLLTATPAPSVLPSISAGPSESVTPSTTSPSASAAPAASAAPTASPARSASPAASASPAPSPSAAASPSPS